MPNRSRPGSATTTQPIVRLQGGAGGDKCATGVKTTIRLTKDGTTIGTRNVLSLHACGKVQKLIHEFKLYRWDILGLTEIRWTGFGETTTAEGHKVWYCGDTSVRGGVYCT